MINTVTTLTTGAVAITLAAILSVCGLAGSTFVADGAIVVEPTFRFGLSIGGFVFHDQATHAVYGPLVVGHETGHTAQEEILGPLYLPLVGIPSLICALTNTYAWPETWADELGGVDGFR